MLSPLLLTIVMTTAFGAVCAAIASRKNRSIYGWFFAGVLLGPFGLIIAFLPKVKPAVVVIDIQGDFTSARKGSLAVPQSDESFLERVLAATRQLKDAGYIILATQDWHPADHVSFSSNHEGRQNFETIELADGSQQTLWPPHCVQDSKGAEILLDTSLIDEVVQKGADYRFDSYSGFRDDGGSKTGLHQILEANGIKSVIIYGIATDYCVKATVMDAISLGYKVYLIEDLCLGVNEETSKEAIKQMSERGAVMLPSMDIKTINRI